MRENMRYAHYWQICPRICDRMFAISWHACTVADCSGINTSRLSGARTCLYFYSHNVLNEIIGHFRPH